MAAAHPWSPPSRVELRREGTGFRGDSLRKTPICPEGTTGENFLHVLKVCETGLSPSLSLSLAPCVRDTLRAILTGWACLTFLVRAISRDAYDSSCEELQIERGDIFRVHSRDIFWIKRRVSDIYSMTASDIYTRCDTRAFNEFHTFSKSCLVLS